MDENIILYVLGKNSIQNYNFFLRRAPRVKGNLRVSVALACHSEDWGPFQFNGGNCLMGCEHTKMRETWSPG